MAEAGGGTGPDRITLGAFVLFVTLAGGNVIAVREVSCNTCELEPFWAAARRVAGKAVPKLVAKMTLVAMATSVLTGVAFIVMMPSAYDTSIGLGLVLRRVSGSPVTRRR